MPSSNESTEKEKAIGFKKGVSGNEKGMEKGVRSWSGLFRAYGQGKDVSGRTRQERIIEKLYDAALVKNERWAICEILDRSMGKAMQQTQVDVTTGGQSLNAAVSFCKVGELPVEIDEVPTVDALPAGEEVTTSGEVISEEPVRKKIQW
jgi:hypothetical protein